MPYRTTILAILLLLNGCASAPEQQADTEPAPQQPTAEQLEESAAELPERPFPEDSLYALLVAEFALRRREYDLALSNYMVESEKLRDPGISAHTTRLAQFMQREKEATQASRLWVEVDPENLEARLTLANLQARQGQARAALENMKYIIDAGGSANFTVLANGFEGLDKNQQEALLGEMRLMQQQHATDSQLMIATALLLDHMGRSQEALEQIQQVFEHSPNQLQAIVLEVKLRQDLGESKDLFKRMQGVLEQEPENARLRMQYARLLTRTDLDEARRQFEILLRDAPANPDLLFSLALIHRENGELDEARSLLERLLATGQRTDEAQFYLGKTAEQQNRFEEALNHYMQVQPGRDFINATNRISSLMLQSGLEVELEQYFEQLRSRYPDFAEQFYALQSDSLSAHDHLQSSLGVLNRGLQQYPASASLQYSRAMLYDQLGDMEMMEQDLRDILQREPENSTALNALGYTLANRTQRYEEAEQLIRKALKLSPGEPAILDSMGWVKYRLGHYQEALVYLQQAYASFPDAEVAAHLGEVLWALGEEDAARQVWLTALATSPEHSILLETMQRFGADASTP